MGAGNVKAQKENEFVPDLSDVAFVEDDTVADLRHRCSAAFARYDLQNKLDDPMKQRLGTGAFGSVYKLNIKLGNSILKAAIKVIRLSNNDPSVTQKEIKILEALQPTNAVPKLINHWVCRCSRLPKVDDANRINTAMYLKKHYPTMSDDQIQLQVDGSNVPQQLCQFILMEQCNEDIVQFWQQHHHHKNNQTFTILYQALIAVGKISVMRCIHGDLRAEHILLAPQKDNNNRCVVLDFGFAHFLNVTAAPQIIQSGWVSNSFPQFPKEATFTLYSATIQPELQCQLFAMFWNCIQLFAHLRHARIYLEWDVRTEGTNSTKTMYFNGFQIDVCPELIEKWMKVMKLPFSLSQIHDTPKTKDAEPFLLSLKNILIQSGILF